MFYHGNCDIPYLIYPLASISIIRYLIPRMGIDYGSWVCGAGHWRHCIPKPSGGDTTECLSLSLPLSPSLSLPPSLPPSLSLSLSLSHTHTHTHTHTLSLSLSHSLTLYVCVCACARARAHAHPVLSHHSLSFSLCARAHSTTCSSGTRSLASYASCACGFQWFTLVVFKQYSLSSLSAALHSFISVCSRSLQASLGSGSRQ